MHEFGKENKQKILLLHGAGSTYKMWTPQIEVLQKEYHVYAPTMSGHELNDVDFISSTHEAELIITWFQKHGINDLLLICGASLGAHVAAEILQKQRTFAQYAMIESLKAYQYKGIILKLFSYIGNKVIKKCASTKGYMDGTYNQKYASDDAKCTINNMSKKTLENIMIESGNYQIKQQKTKIFEETMILYGSKEKKECKSNTEILQKQIEKCTIVEIPKYRHGELAIGNPYKHLEYLKKLISQGSI